MNSCFYRACIAALSCIAIPAHATSDSEVILWGGSHHFQEAPNGRTWNECNPGIGFRVYFKPHSGVEPFVEADYIVKNSTGGSLALLGGGAQSTLARTGTLSVVAGFVAGFGRYENVWTKEHIMFPGGYPFVGLRQENTTVSLGYIPGVRSRGFPSGDVAVVTFGFRF